MDNGSIIAFGLGFLSCGVLVFIVGIIGSSVDTNLRMPEPPVMPKAISFEEWQERHDLAETIKKLRADVL